MVGAADSGKTTLTVEMIAACARGGLLWGRYPCKKISSILYLHGEHSLYTLSDIVHARGDIPPDLVNVIHDFGMTGSKLILDQRPNTALIREVYACADKIKPDLIIVEPISAFISASENDNTEARAIITLLNVFANKYKAAILTHHHFSKAVHDPERQRPSGMPTGDTRGAQAFEDAAERIIYLRRDATQTKIETPKPKGYSVANVHLTRNPTTCHYTLATDMPGPDVVGLCHLIRSHGAKTHKSVLIPQFAATWKCPISYVEQLYTRAGILGLVSSDGRLCEETGATHV